MAQTIEFYELRAEESAEDARKATLENVRERALRSEAAWRKMAERAIEIERGREKRREEKEAVSAEPES